jgi:hypothetical protein
MSRGLVVLPDDGAAPIVDAIRGATSSLRLKMFVLTHERLIAELVAAHGRGADGPRHAQSGAAERQGGQRRVALRARRRPASPCRTAARRSS